MFDTLPISHLATMLAHFAFPMLIAERPDRTAEFRTVAMNAALEEIAGPKDAICGMTLRDVFPSSVVEDLVGSFRSGTGAEDIQRIKSAIRGISGEVPCDLTLQFLRCSDGYDRIIATAQPDQRYELDLQDKLAFEDVRYFSSVADLQLENLNSAFVSATDLVQAASVSEERMMRLHAVCRTIQRTVSDIQNVVKQAQARHAEKGESHIFRTHSVQSQELVPHQTSMFDALTESNVKKRRRVS